ncbi:ferritin-like domain-containing protein [Cellvibrio sp. ARAG 10.3]|uniref:ferritin-like domain-containing protein n=1 Tax=Cellvibrio sp. ARAG 10.3 TaxID=3451358 RepID=UPI003F470563
MTTDQINEVLDWLRDAFAMELQSGRVFTNLVNRMEEYPRLKNKFKEHLEQTYRQQELLKGCIERLGSSPSIMKDLAGKVIAFGQSVAGMSVSDEVVKATMSSYVFKQMEISSYTILIAASEARGDHETKAVCETILAQEVAMANWLRENLPLITREFLNRSEQLELAAEA